MFEIGVALTLNCFILNIFYRNYEMLPWVRRLVFDKLARVVRVEVPHMRTQEYLDKSLGDDIETNSETTISNIEEMELTSSNGETSSTQPQSAKTKTFYSKKKPSVQQQMLSENTTNTKLPKSHQSIRLVLSCDPVVRLAEQKLLSKDWKIVARILDRIMLILATFVGVVSAMAIFLQAERFRQMLTI